MSYSRPVDFFTEVRLGNLAEHSVVHKFGRNDDVPNNSWILVSSSSISGTFPTSAKSVRIKAGGNIADISGGLGANSITVIGIDSELNKMSETIVTSGADASLATTTLFWRIYRSYVTGVGTYNGANVGDIVIESSDGANDMLVITADEGQTQHAAYSLPSGKTGYLLSLKLTTDATKRADFRLFVRENFNNTQAPMRPRRLRLSFDGVLGAFVLKTVSPNIRLSALSDIWVEARGGGANTEVSVDFEILLVDNPSGPIKAI